jgi:deazaflavin-dependent oxidoreductase (nitroreductase family)
MPSDFDQQIIDEFRANDGRVGGPFDGMSLLILHHEGARSEQPYLNPLAFLEDDGRYVIFASKAGAPENPAWYHNLKAHPDTSIEVGDATLEVRAEEATGEERDRLYARMAERAPQFAEYEKQTERVIPVMVLTPTEPT